MTNHRVVIQLLRAFVLAAIVACSSDSALGPAVRATPNRPVNEVSDGAHSRGGLANPHFFYLPPAVPQPAFAGTFDGTQSPEVAICQYDATTGCVGAAIANYTMTTGSGSEVIRVDAAGQLYIVNWHTDQFALDLTKTYRIRTLVAGTELGHADVILGASKTSLKNVDTQQDIALLDGKTLPIKFRIEKGAIAAIGENGGSLALPDGGLSLTVPAGALAGTLGVTALPTTSYPEDPEIASSVYELGPAGTTFATPATLTISYDPAALPSDAAVTDVGLYTVAIDADGVERWSYIAGATVDATHHTVSAPISHFSRWAVLATPSSVSVTPAKASVYVPENEYGQAHNTVQLSATVTGSGGKTLTNRVVQWTSADPTLATVSPVGLVTGVAAGSVNVTATSSTATATSALGVLRPVERIVLLNSRTLSLVPTNDHKASSGTLSVGLYAKLDASTGTFTAVDASGRTITYASENPDVATVDANGLVTGLKAGVASITVSCDGFNKSFQVIVEGAVVEVMLSSGFTGSSVGPVFRAYSVDGQITFQSEIRAIPRDAGGNWLFDRSVDWQFDPTQVSVIERNDEPGVFFILPSRNGHTTITAQVEGHTATVGVHGIVLTSRLQYLNPQAFPLCHDAGPFGLTYDSCAGSNAKLPAYFQSEIVGTVPNTPFQPLFSFSIRGFSSPGVPFFDCCAGGQTLQYLEPGVEPGEPIGQLSNYNSWNTIVGVVTTADFTSSEDADGEAVSWQLKVHHRWSLCGLFGADHCYSEEHEDSPGFNFYDWSGQPHSVTIVSLEGRYYFRQF